MTSHFSWLKRNYHLLTHSLNLFRLGYPFQNPFRLFDCAIDFGIISINLNIRCFICRDVIYINNKKMGPSIVPWGTPDITGEQSEVVPVNTTRCILLGGVYMIPARLSFRHEFTPLPSCGSVFVYMIPA